MSQNLGLQSFLFENILYKSEKLVTNSERTLKSDLHLFEGKNISLLMKYNLHVKAKYFHDSLYILKEILLIRFIEFNYVLNRVIKKNN